MSEAVNKPVYSLEHPLSQEDLKEVLVYNEDTGDFIWLKRLGRRGKVGSVAGSNNSNYICIRINRVGYLAHRLAYLYVEGFVPPQVDHEDHDGLNNKWLNLRAADNKLNHKNKSLLKTNKSGFNGVCYYPAQQKWRVSITVEGTQRSIGSFDTKAEAIQKRKEANIEFNYHSNHGLAL